MNKNKSRGSRTDEVRGGAEVYTRVVGVGGRRVSTSRKACNVERRESVTGQDRLPRRQIHEGVTGMRLATIGAWVRSNEGTSTREQITPC